MDRERAKELAAIIKAFGDGESVEIYNEQKRLWELQANPIFRDCSSYRTKPKPREFTLERIKTEPRGNYHAFELSDDTDYKHLEYLDDNIRVREVVDG